MNAHIAAFLKDKIAALTYVDKLAGLVQLVSSQRQGGLIKMPVALEVTDPLNCSAEVLRDLVPNDGYRMIVYFEDRGITPIHENNRSYLVSHLRLVAWINTSKMGGNQRAGDLALAEFIAKIKAGPYNSDMFLGLTHKVESIPAKGAELFSAYSYPDDVRKYLFPPFDSFGIDIASKFMLDPSCGPAVDPSTVTCP